MRHGVAYRLPITWHNYGYGRLNEIDRGEVRWRMIVWRFAARRRSVGDALPLPKAFIIAILAIINGPHFSAAESRQEMAVCQ